MLACGYGDHSPFWAVCAGQAVRTVEQHVDRLPRPASGTSIGRDRRRECGLARLAITVLLDDDHMVRDHIVASHHRLHPLPGLGCCGVAPP
jgi:hypothetical protein